MIGLARRALLAAVGLSLVFAGSASAQAEINLEPAGGLDFGGRDLGTRWAGTVAVFNDGNAPSTIGTSSLIGSSSLLILDDGCAGETLNTDEGCPILVGFAPTVAGPQSAQLSVPSDAPGSPELLTVQGLGLAPPAPPPPPPSAPPPSLAPLPSSLQLGAVRVNAVGTAQSLLLTPSGSVAFVQSVRVEGADASAFRVAPCPMIVRPDRPCSLAVTFAPTRQGLHQATLVVEGSGGPYRVALIGTGTPPPLPKDEIAKSLSGALGTQTGAWRASNGRKVRRAGGFRLRTQSVTASGKVELTLSTADRRRRLVAKGRVAVSAGRRAVVNARLTKAGRGLFAKRGKRRLRATLTFIAADGTRVSSSRSFTLPS